MNMKLYTIDSQFIRESIMRPPNFTGMVKWFDGAKSWWYTGKRHRLDGPAIEWHDGIEHWFVDGKNVAKEQHNLLVSIMKLKGLLRI